MYQEDNHVKDAILLLMYHKYDTNANAVKTLQQQNKQLIEALEFYATKANYTENPFSVLLKDEGQIANQALQQIKRKEETK